MVYGLYVLFPARLGLLVTAISERRSLLPIGHLPLGRQDHTTSPSASRALVSCAFGVHRIPPRVRYVRYAPLIGSDGGMLFHDGRKGEGTLRSVPSSRVPQR